MNKIETINDWHPEIRSAMRTIKGHGFEFVDACNGEEVCLAKGGVNAMLETLTACDEASLRCSKDGKIATFYFVMGNSPGELIADCSHHKDLGQVTDSIIEAHFKLWDGQAQPRKTGYYSDVGKWHEIRPNLSKSQAKWEELGRRTLGPPWWHDGECSVSTGVGMWPFHRTEPIKES